MLVFKLCKSNLCCIRKRNATVNKALNRSMSGSFSATNPIVILRIVIKQHHTNMKEEAGCYKGSNVFSQSCLLKTDFTEYVACTAIGLCQ